MNSIFDEQTNQIAMGLRRAVIIRRDFVSRRYRELRRNKTRAVAGD